MGPNMKETGPIILWMETEFMLMLKKSLGPESSLMDNLTRKFRKNFKQRRLSKIKFNNLSIKQNNFSNSSKKTSQKVIKRHLKLKTKHSIRNLQKKVVFSSKVMYHAELVSSVIGLVNIKITKTMIDYHTLRKMDT